MRQKHLYAAALIAFFVFVLLPLNASAQTARQAGKVADADGNAIVGAKVVFDRAQPGSGMNHKELETDEKGEFILTGVGGGPWRVTVEAPGYVPFTQIVQISSFTRNPNLDIVLKKVENVPPAEDSVRAKAEDAVAEADKLIDEGKYDEAITVYEQFIADNEGKEGVFKVNLLIGQVYEMKGEYETAIEKFKVVLDNDPEDANALLGIGNAYIRLKQYDEAKQYYERLVEIKGNDPNILYTLAEMMMDNGNYDGAVEYYGKAIDLNPNFADAHMKMGYAYFGKKDYANAIQAFEKFLQLAPDRPEAEFIKSDIEACKQKLAEQ